MNFESLPGGQFASARGGQFGSAKGGHIKSAGGGQVDRRLHLWIETDRKLREAYRDDDTTDYPRLGYVAFSRAKKLLCISCLEKIQVPTQQRLAALGIVVIPESTEESRTPAGMNLFE